MPPALVHPRSRAHELGETTPRAFSEATFSTLPFPPQALQSSISPLSLHPRRFITIPKSPLLDGPPPGGDKGEVFGRSSPRGNSLDAPAQLPPPNIPVPAPGSPTPASPSSSSASQPVLFPPIKGLSISSELNSGNNTRLLSVLQPERRSHRRHRSNLLNSPSIDITHQFAAERSMDVESLQFLSEDLENKKNRIGGERMELKLKRILMNDVTPLGLATDGAPGPEAPIDNGLRRTLDEPFSTPPTLHRRFSTPLQSVPSHIEPNYQPNSDTNTDNVGLGILTSGEDEVIGLGIVDELLHATDGARESVELRVRGLTTPGGGFDHPHLYDTGIDLLPLEDQYQDPPSPPPLAPSASPRSVKATKKKQARLPSSKGIVIPGVLARSHSKRIYPRIRSDNSPKQIKTRQIMSVGHKHPQPFEMVSDRGTPDLSGLPGAFIASPVLPTSFTDFSHSPLPTPPTRFARLRKNVATPSPQFGAYTSFTSTSTSSVADCTSSSLNVSTTSALMSPLLSTSPVGTPTLPPASAFASALSDAEPSASSTPTPDTQSASFTNSTGGTSYGNAATTSDAAIFDIAITSTIIGAIVCLGAVTWLALSMLRGRSGRPQERSGSTGKFSRYDSDEKPSPRLAQISYPQPQPPPLARLSFQRTPEPFRGEDVFGGGWINEGTIRGAGTTTEDHGGYPEIVMRGDGASLLQRRASGASVASRTSQVTASTRPNTGRQISSSRRTSGESSIADSTFSRSSAAASSRTSHGISPTPPRIPSPVGIRYSGEAFFTTPPETPTKGRWVSAEDEPPVPIVPLDFREFTFSPPSPPVSRSRSSTHSTVPSKSARSIKTVAGSSSASLKARKLQKRRATVDGATLREGQDKTKVVDVPDSKITGTAEDEDSGKGDATSTSSNARPTQTLPRKSSLKKPRPVTMPPAIVVSDHPQDLVPPSSPVKPISSSEPDSSPDSRASVKTFQTMPWIRQSASSSSGWTTNFPRDDCSILDPDMRSSRNPSIDNTRFSVQTLVRRGTAPSGLHGASTLTKGEEDQGSITSAEHSEGDPDDEQGLRNLRRKTLLYSVYQQRGVFIRPPTPSPDMSPVKSLSGTDSESTVDSMTGKVTKRQSIVLSFPTPPEGDELATDAPTPTLQDVDGDATPKQPPAARFSGTSLDLEYDIEQFELNRIGSSPSLRALARSKTFDTVAASPSESDIASVFCPIDDAEDFLPRSTLPTMPSSPGPPPRPAKSLSRKSSLLDDGSSSSSFPATPTSASRIPIAARAAPTRIAGSISPFADLATQSAPRSFAADLQAAVGSPATGYDSDTLLSNLNFRKPYSLLTSSMYSTHSSSIESLEDAAIARAESVQFGGRGRASGIPRRSILHGSEGRRNLGYESDESTYDDSETESLDMGNRHLTTVLERDGY